MTYEKLLGEIEKEGIEFFENNHILGMKGLYVDNTITLNTNIDTDIERKCVLAEELGHHYTSYGNIVDQSKVENRKQERRARAWAYDKLIGIIGIINSYKYGCRNKYEMAEYLNVTEEFIDDALKYYKEKYGLLYEVDNYIVYFEPLGVLEKLE
ncbi:ImmA/IrrE family metallo-endopeptidase [Anaerosalibacter massiliensis]|uniref:ImmA/IrrE family metallo-endopeptidase n=1 Tax=Anaerosalibacter massiliensis TaxID=1347392 RepID=A0A9X2S8W9_9FIRM|nr:ImmA/IrrE family metallo-endopeptidase [Anaerosalibacter massiliensis]MCR2045526.1 ImmA/IrrE family metallo-endopeptidase [Anaerosalibacter massiliensis]